MFSNGNSLSTSTDCRVAVPRLLIGPVRTAVTFPSVFVLEAGVVVSTSTQALKDLALNLPQYLRRAWLYEPAKPLRVSVAAD